MLKRVVNTASGVINTVKEEKYIELMESGEYQDFPDEEEAPKRKRRTKEEIEADKAGGK